MKKFLLTLFLVLTLLGVSATAVEARVSVRGYTTRRGTYVQPHYRSNPNRSRYDNWSSRGNYNPYTGRKGYRSSWR